MSVIKLKTYTLKLGLLAGVFLTSMSCVIDKCQVLTVIDKNKCTFDRKFKARVCVAKLGRIEDLSLKSIRGRTVSTILPEPLDPYSTEVEMCIRKGKRVFNKL